MSEKKETTAIALSPEERAKALVEAIGKIDKDSLKRGAPLIVDLRKIEWNGMWMKGMLVLQHFPELENATPRQGGRPKKGEERRVSYRYVAEKIGHSEPTVLRWVKFVLTVGKDERSLNKYLLSATRPAVETWQRRLLRKVSEEQRESDPVVRRSIEQKTFLQIQERVETGEDTPEDAKWLVERVRMLTDSMRKVLQKLLDERPASAIKIIENVMGGES